MSRNAAVVPVVLALLTPGAALAACAEPYTADAFRAAVATADAALAEADVDTAQRALQEAGNQLGCLAEPVNRTDLATFARKLSFLAFLGQDDFAVVKYGLMARQADPELPWSEMFSEDHPFRETVANAPDAVIGGPEMPLATPKNGAFYMNGVLVAEAKAPAEVPQFVQVFDKKGALIEAFWQDGAAFPDRWLVGSGVTPPGGSGGGLSFSLEPMTVAGGGLVVASGVLYLLAGVVAGGLDDATTEQELAGTRTATNLLVLGSGVTFAAGAGLAATGVLLDGGTPGVAVHVRF